MCAQLGVYRSSYYAWRDRAESKRSQADRQLAKRIQHLFVTHRRRYGSPRIHATLRREGIRIGRKRVEKIMRNLGLRAIYCNRYQPSYRYMQKLAAAPNLLKRDFRPSAVNKVWAGDITIVDYHRGRLYLAVIMDLYSREIIGWSLQKTPGVVLITNAMVLALARRQPQPGLIFHSDRGSQYRSRAFQTLLREQGFVSSMSGVGDCWDNAPVESFFQSMKVESLYPEMPADANGARRQIFEYIERYYNRKRLHSSLGYTYPVERSEGRIYQH